VGKPLTPDQLNPINGHRSDAEPSGSPKKFLKSPLTTEPLVN
jgi:hypothetical protein